MTRYFALAVATAVSFGCDSGSSSYRTKTGSFVATGGMLVGRNAHTATLLTGGDVLVAGGTGTSGSLASAERYDTSTATFVTTGSMTTERSGHTATLLPDGTVLITGGYGSAESTATAELYDAATETFDATGSMTTARQAHTATLLPGGKVLVAGGYQVDASGSFTALASAELFDPVAGTFTATGSMTEPRSGHTATLLGDGRVLVVGGIACTGNSSAWNCTTYGSAELYDPVAGTFAATGDMGPGSWRYAHTATILSGGKVLVAGGDDGSSSTGIATAHLYDPLTQTFTPTGGMTTPREFHSAALLPNGTVLVAGAGYKFVDSAVHFGNAEVYDPHTGAFVVVPPDGARDTVPEANTATLLPTGKVLVAGGHWDWCYQTYCSDGPGASYSVLYDP
jgi:hypothetical protein